MLAPNMACDWIRRRWTPTFVASMLLIVYIIVGAIIIKAIEGRKSGSTIPWTYFNSIYFLVVTLSTVGYGDMTPKTPGGRVFIVIYSIFGIALLGLVVAQIAKRVLEFVQHKHKQEDAASAAVSNSAKALLSTNRILLVVLCAYLVVWLVFSLLFSVLERRNPDTFNTSHWHYGTSLYFTFITMTTIGYGDYYPHTVLGRLLVIVMIFLGVGVLSTLIGHIAAWLSESADKSGGADTAAAAASAAAVSIN